MSEVDAFLQRVLGSDEKEWRNIPLPSRETLFEAAEKWETQCWKFSQWPEPMLEGDVFQALLNWIIDRAASYVNYYNGHREHAEYPPETATCATSIYDWDAVVMARLLFFIK